MTVVVCIDNGNGILFNRRRVSSDREVTARILELSGDAPVFMSPYSAKLFPEGANIIVSETFFQDAPDGSFCFVEQALPEGVLDRVRNVIVFKWNRLYPSDVKFPLEALIARAAVRSVTEFEGHSHDKITQEVYEL